jgi:hypothetical protein
MSEASPAEPTPETDPALGTDLHPVDRAFLAQKFAGGPLIFGVLSLLSSVIILGMLPGALGLRAGIDLWQRGVRRGVVIAGVVTSFVGVAASILCALLWGSILASVLLGRDAMRETERWRGEVLEPFSLTAIESISGETFSFEIPPRDERVERVVLLLAGVGETPSAEAISTAVRVAERHPQCRLLVVTPLSALDDGKSFATLASASTAVAVVGSDANLPAPINSVAAFPTMVIIDRAGRIEFALVGSRREEELDRLFSGEAARAAAEHERALQEAASRTKTRGAITNPSEAERE